MNDTPCYQITLTEDAVKMANQMRLDIPAHSGHSLRIYLSGKGCEGFLYGVAFDNSSDKDLHFPHSDLDIIVDSDAIAFINGSNVEWVDDDRGRGFMVTNPNHNAYRGKFFKKPDWKARLEARLAGSESADLNAESQDDHDDHDHHHEHHNP